MKQQKFQQIVWGFYENHGRRDLPWRLDLSPYSVLVSEIMLQQTQVPRVIEKYTSWMKQFKNFRELGRAPTEEVLIAWKGLGYNRRALSLHRTAKIVAEEHSGNLPRNEDALLALPGIGPYTAGAVRAFAWNEPHVFIETNIRTVYIHHFFEDKKHISDKDLMPVIEETLDHGNTRKWYWALMDYGTHLKKEIGNLAQKSKHYTKQSPFEGSNRQLRSLILSTVLEKKKATKREVTRAGKNFEKKQIEKNIDALISEGFIKKHKKFYIPTR